MARMYGGGETGVGRTLPFSFLFPPPTGFATKGNPSSWWCNAFVSGVLTTSLGDLQSTGLCSYKQPYGVQTPETPPRGQELDSLLICNFFFPLREQSLVMDPKQLTKVCLRCVLVSKCRLTIQNEPSKQNKTKNETKHKNLSQQQKQPRKTLRARMIWQVLHISWYTKFK